VFALDGKGFAAPVCGADDMSIAVSVTPGIPANVGELIGIENDLSCRVGKNQEQNTGWN
jgi:hypothetical protein